MVIEALFLEIWFFICKRSILIFLVRGLDCLVEFGVVGLREREIVRWYDEYQALGYSLRRDDRNRGVDHDGMERNSLRHARAF